MKPLSYHLGIFSADNSIQLSFVVVFLCNTTAKKLPTISQFAFSSQKSETPHCCETSLCVQSKSLEFSSRVCLPLKTATAQHNIPPFNFFQLSIVNFKLGNNPSSTQHWGRPAPVIRVKSSDRSASNLVFWSTKKLWNRDHLYYLHIPHEISYESIVVNNIFGDYRAFTKPILKTTWGFPDPPPLNGGWDEMVHIVAMEKKIAKCDLPNSRLIFIPEEHLLEAEDVATPDLGDLHFTSEFGRTSTVRRGQS